MDATITEQLREKLQESTASTRAVGKATGIDHTHIWRWLNGERDLTGRQVDALAAWLGLRLTKRIKRN